METFEYSPKKYRSKIYELYGLPYNTARGEQAMWAAVITQALMDALSASKSSEAQFYKNEAIHWLTENSSDFICVCQLAGLNPTYVRRSAKRALASPKPWRAPPGKGRRYLERKAYRQKKPYLVTYPSENER